MPTLIEDRAGRLKAMRELAAKAEAEGRDFTPDERSALEGHMTEVKSLGDRIAEDSKSQRFSEDLTRFLAEADTKALNDDHADLKSWAGTKRIKSIGEMFVESPEFVESMKAHNGSVGKSARFQMHGAMEVPGGLKALLGVGAAGGDGVSNLLDPQRLPTIPAAWRQLVLRSVITTGTTTADQVKYARQLRVGIPGGSVNAAAGVPEAVTDAAVGSGTTPVTPVQAGVKPQSTIKFSIETASVITIAHWVAATKQALSDEGQLRTLIDNFLAQGLDQELERQILSGDSDNGEEFDGILNTSGTLSQAYSGGIVETIRKAITKVKKDGLAIPNAILISPEDAEAIDLLKAEGTGNYLGANPFGPAVNNTLWRLPLVEVPTLAAGTALVGDFKTAVLWDREQTTITATDSHADFFIRNLVAILGESRAAFGVLEPDHIVVADVAA